MKHSGSILALFFFLFTFPPLFAAEPGGEVKSAPVWSGDLPVGGAVVPIVFRLVETDGKPAALFSSPKQTPREFPATIELKGQTLLLAVPSLNSSFEGTISEDGNTATGQWIQGKAKLSMVLHKEMKAIGPRKRPQLPQPPFPYKAIEVTIENQAASVRLAGTLTLPSSGGPHPAAILITGSGPQDRDETLFNHKPFLVIADHLTRAGIAVLRYDDRGVGASTGRQDNCTSADFAADARAAFDFLAHYENIDSKRIGLIGHSEGGVIAPIVAGQTNAAFVIHLAGPVLSGADILRRQFISRLQSAPERQREQASAFLEKLIATLQETETGKADPKFLLKLFNDHAASLSEENRQAFMAQRETISRNAQVATTLWTHHYIKYDPADSLRALKCPLLALYGGKDVQVESAPNIARLREILPGAKNLTIREFPSLNHLFQTATTGALAEYPIIEETISPEVLAAMRDFILSAAKPG